jgi:hypothetical protein
MASTLNGTQFSQLLVDQTPVFDKMILEDIRPEDGWILHVETGKFPAYSGVQHTLDRFNHVWPDVTKAWTPTQAGNCLGTPCTKTENYITWGSTRLTYFLEEQSWATPLLCFDQEMHVTHAKEQFRQIITDILKPATSAVNSNFLRKRVAQFTKNKWVANGNFGVGGDGVFQYQWLQTSNSDGTTSEAYIDTNANPTRVFMLTPQMLQRRVQPLMQVGYFGKQPFKDMPPLIELVTDLETLWSLDYFGGQQGVGSGQPSVTGNWRFESWDGTSKYWKYNFTGQIGNYAVRVDPFNLRFSYVGAISGTFPWGNTSYRYNVVLPYVNSTSSGAGGASGLKDDVNPAYANAQFRFTYIWHRRALQVLVADASPVNPEMPYSSRNFGGKWQFVMDNLGVDVNGVAIENKRRNKGQFIADFKQAIRPQYTEFSELIFHKSAPAAVAEIATGVTDANYPYPTQNYSSNPATCAGPTTNTLTFTPIKVANGYSPLNGSYYIPANSITCNDDPAEHGQIGDPTNLLTTLDLLVAALNAQVGSLGVWAKSGSNITLTGTCYDVEIPWGATS